MTYFFILYLKYKPYFNSNIWLPDIIDGKNCDGNLNTVRSKLRLYIEEDHDAMVFLHMMC